MGILVAVTLIFSGLSSSSYAAHTATLAWDTDSSPQVVGYRVHCGKTSASYDQSVDVGNFTTVALTGLDAGTTYFAVVTAYGADGVESAPSNEITFSLAPDPVPYVSLSSPGSTINGPATITLNASATEQGGIITKVEFFAGANKLGETSTAPYTLVWNNAQPGYYNLVAVAHDSNGGSAASATVSINIVAFSVTNLVQTGDGIYHLTASGAPGSSYSVYISDDLVSWRLLKTVTNTNGTVNISDETALGVPRRFYKLMLNSKADKIAPVAVPASLKTTAQARK